MARDAELTTLHIALAETRPGCPQVVFIHGESGIGKSTLLGRFAATLRETDAALVVESRCYENESVPFKALDGAIDELSRIASIRGSNAPPGTADLLRAFPVLRQAFSDDVDLSECESAADPQWKRARMVDALRAWFSRITCARPLAFCIDDLHWGDADGARLLAEVMIGDRAPALLLVGCYRDDATENPFLSAFNERAIAAGRSARNLALAPLSSAEATALVARLSPNLSLADATALVAHAAGNPFLTTELTLKQHGDGPPALASLIDERLGRLPDSAASILSVIAVAGHPLDDTLLAETLPDSAPLDPQVVQALCAARLARTRPGVARATIEPYHDLIAKAVRARVSESEARRYHEVLASALIARDGKDDALIVAHCVAAGQTARARRHARAAAERARDALAFDQAAAFYRLARDVDATDVTRHARLTIALAEVLEAAGRGAEAAQHFLEVLALVRDGHTPLELTARDAQRALRRRAADQLLACGAMDQGRALVDAVCTELGVRLTKSRRRARVSTLVHRSWARVTKLRYVEKPLDGDTSARLELLAALCLGFGLTDFSAGADLSARYLTSALRAGSSYHVAYALAIASTSIAREGLGHAAWAKHLFTKAVHTALRAQNLAFSTPPALPLAIASTSLGDFRAGRDAALASLSMIPTPRTSSIGETQVNMLSGVRVAWTVASSHFFLATARFYLGELRALARDLPDALRTARERGDAYAAGMLGSGFGVTARLAHGRVDEAIDWLVVTRKHWQTRDYYLQDFLLALGHWFVAAYRGDFSAAHARLTADWSSLARSAWLYTPLTALTAYHMRGQLAVASAAELRVRGIRASGRRAILLADAMHCARIIARLPMHRTRGLATLLRAAIAEARGARDVLPLLADAEASLSAQGLRLYAAAAQGARGRRLGGTAGRALDDAAGKIFAEEGIVDPVAFSRLLMPGLPT